MRISRLTITALIAVASTTVLFAMPKHAAMSTETDTVENAAQAIASAELAYAPEMDANQVISPDGKTIAFDSWRDGNGEIYTMKADGSSLVRLTHISGFDSQPVWSPDGKRLAFTSQRDGNDEIYVMDADGGNQLRLTRSDDHDGNPCGRRTAHASPSCRDVMATGTSTS